MRKVVSRLWRRGGEVAEQGERESRCIVEQVGRVVEQEDVKLLSEGR